MRKKRAICNHSNTKEEYGKGGHIGCIVLQCIDCGKAIQTKKMSEEERFWLRVRKTENGCWQWTGTINGGRGGGYAYLYIGNHIYIKAHRWAYEHFVGKIPPDKEIDHLCRNRSCVNPDHLEAVYPQINNLRGVGAAANNAKKNYCPRGHIYDILTVRARRCSICEREMKLASYHRLKPPLTRKGWQWKKKG